MKGVLKIKFLKKYIPILLTAFVFLFININGVDASEYDYKNGLLDEISYELIGTNNNPFDNDLTTAVNPIQNISLDKYIFDIEAMFIKTGNSLTIEFYDINNNLLDTIFIEKYQDEYVNLDKKIENVNYIKFIGGQHKIVYEIDFFGTIQKEDYKYNISNLNYDINDNEITFNYDLPNDNNFNHLELHQDGLLLADNILTNNFEVTNLEYDTKYNFTFYAVDKDGNKSTGITREISIPENPALIPSNNIFNLNHSVSDTTVTFNYSLPSDPNFSHLKIYRNNELINDNYQLTEFTDINLTPETEYNYRFVSVNKMDISNAGYSITVKTMIENDTVPPAVPTGLNAKAMNSGIILSWNSNNETDLKGYNIYLNGTKLNKNPISNTIYNVTNLENGIEYNFTVSAVDNFDNESEQSLVVSSIPDVEKLPIFKLDTSLSSVGNSIENWFSEIWVIVAFATSIPLAFLIAQRVKYLFIA